MNPLPFILSIALLTGCNRVVIDTPGGPVTCYSARCAEQLKEFTPFYQNLAKKKAEKAAAKAKAKAEEERKQKEQQAWDEAHPEEVARRDAQNRRAMEQYLINQSVNAYGCPGASIPAYWSRSMGPYACGYRPY